jgi:hypothetical protein
MTDAERMRQVRALNRFREALREELRNRRDEGPPKKKHLYEELIKLVDRGEVLRSRNRPSPTDDDE